MELPFKVKTITQHVNDWYQAVKPSLETLSKVAMGKVYAPSFTLPNELLIYNYLEEHQRYELHAGVSTSLTKDYLMAWRVECMKRIEELASYWKTAYNEEN